MARCTGALRDAVRNPALAISESRFTPISLRIDDNILGYFWILQPQGARIAAGGSQLADMTGDVRAIDLAAGHGSGSRKRVTPWGESPAIRTLVSREPGVRDRIPPVKRRSRKPHEREVGKASIENPRRAIQSRKALSQAPTVERYFRAYRAEACHEAGPAR